MPKGEGSLPPAPSSPEDPLRVLRDSSVKIKPPNRDEVFFLEERNGYSEMMSPSSIAYGAALHQRRLLLRENFYPRENGRGILLQKPPPDRIRYLG